MDNVKRLYPEAKTALIKWIEDNFAEIDDFIFTAHCKDGTTMTIYDVSSYFNACAINNIQNDTIHTLAREDMLILKGDA